MRAISLKKGQYMNSVRMIEILAVSLQKKGEEEDDELSPDILEEIEDTFRGRVIPVNPKLTGKEIEESISQFVLDQTGHLPEKTVWAPTGQIIETDITK